MPLTKQDLRSVGAHLEQIRELEDKLIGLKRRFLEKNSSILESLIDENGGIPFLIAASNDRLFAIPVSMVEEVIEMVAPTSVVEKQRGLLGVFNYHGKLTALFDLSVIVGGGRTGISADNVIIICGLGDRYFGLMANEATDVYMTGEDDLHISEEVIPGTVKAIGIVKLPEGTASIPDIWSTVLGTDPEDWNEETGPETAGVSREGDS